MGKRINSLDVLGQVRRSLRILRKVERYLVQQERRRKVVGVKAGLRLEAEVDRVNRTLAEYGEQG